MFDCLVVLVNLRRIKTLPSVYMIFFLNWILGEA